MLLTEMETTTWNQLLAETGKTQARLNDTTITVSDGYQGKLPGEKTETFVIGEVALVMRKETAPTYYERTTFVKMDEVTRDQLVENILYTLKKKEGIDVEDIDLNFQPVDNRL